MKRKRAPGGGRKPNGPIAKKSETFTTRIRVDTKRWLQREAKRSGHSLSQEVELRLVESLRSGQRQKQDDVARRRRALSHMIESKIIAGVEFVTRKSWSADRFAAETVRIALPKLMIVLMARLALDAHDYLPPRHLPSQLQTPEGLAESIVAGFMDQLDAISELPVAKKHESFSDIFHLVPQLRRDLDLVGSPAQRTTGK